MDPQIDWQISCRKIRARGKYLLDNEKWADCRFLVGTWPLQSIISGHKLILAMASPVFERMFYGSFNLPEDKTDPIRISDVQPDAFRAMMEYIYSDKISIDSFDKACELYYVADKYILPYVVEQCKNYLYEAVCPKNACRTYEFAKLYEEEILMQRCLEIISTKTREVLVDPSFIDIKLSTLLLIFQHDQLNIDSEIELFNALQRYATERGYVPQPIAPVVPVMDSKDETENAGEIVMKSAEPPVDVKSMQEGINKQRGDANVASDDDQENKVLGQNCVKKAIKLIRFLTLSAQEFAEGPARSKLLTPQEALSISINISSQKINDFPMPPGFCTFKNKRFNLKIRNQQLQTHTNAFGAPQQLQTHTNAFGARHKITTYTNAFGARHEITTYTNAFGETQIFAAQTNVPEGFYTAGIDCVEVDGECLFVTSRTPVHIIE